MHLLYVYTYRYLQTHLRTHAALTAEGQGGRREAAAAPLVHAHTPVVFMGISLGGILGAGYVASCIHACM